MVLCAECKRKSVYIDNSGQPAEFCSNQCRKTAVEQRHVQPCIKCRTWPMIRLPDGTRSPYCGKQCQNSAGANSPVGSPISPQSYRPASYPTMVQQNHPNPPIGMPPHQQLLPSGSARPSPWVMTTIPFCRYCQSKPCWNDPVKNLYSEYCSRRCKEAAKRAPRAVSNMNNALPQPNYNGQIISSASTDSSLLSSMSQYQLYHQTQPPPLPQRSPPNDDLQQPQASDSSLNSNPSGHHFRYPNTDTPTSHPNSQVSDSQAPPPPIPTNKPTQTRPQQINMVPINTSVQSSPSSQLSTEIPSSSQAQAQEQNQSRSLVPSQSQVPNNSRPRSQSDELHPGINENTYILTPYGFNPESNTIDVPPPYTPNEAFTGNVAPGEDISIRKITRDDTYDDENPYGFRDANNNNSDEQEQNNNQSNNNQEQRTRMRWLR
ncbi:hypothetical protein GLOIN_2v1502388 [Rhizophagus clarus]|uniref:Uncharacterized protein n=1 Tax=Rhizophagus clarus TaxID=94130 RepID=A0A8H3QHN8_9GLOM|nr:hypothetical protein GLOIN_2v1502388 [Rhizophagus clarus]